MMTMQVGLRLATSRLLSPTPKSLRWQEPKNAFSASLLSLVDHRLPPDFLTTGLPLLP
jgi:hypothetical protein